MCKLKRQMTRINLEVTDFHVPVEIARHLFVKKIYPTYEHSFLYSSPVSCGSVLGIISLVFT